MMSNFKNNLDKLVSKILNEEIENKVKQISEEMGEWTEIKVDEELHGGQKKIDVAEPKGKITAADFKKLRDKKEVDEVYFSDEEDEEEDDSYFDFDGDDSEDEEMEMDRDKFHVTRKPKMMGSFDDEHVGEAETEEGNAFSGALADAKKSGKDSFEVDGKTYNVKENRKSSLKLTEDELIDLIEQIVLEQSVKDKDEKSNISNKSPEGLKKTDKVLGLNKKENDDYAKEVIKKMKDYMKDMFSGEKSYDENPDDFPQSNYDMEKEHNEKKYHPSDAVDEYIEAFAYPGMTNLVYDEIKPDDEMISKQIKGDSKNGNAVTGSDGNALGNVSKRSQKTGERFKKNFDENLYGAEQQKASYKRQPQETIEVAGENKTKGSLKSKQGADKASSINKASKILNTLESTEDKKSKVISEEMKKMKDLIGYNRKTQ
jgi:hypothetical protein